MPYRIELKESEDTSSNPFGINYEFWNFLKEDNSENNSSYKPDDSNKMSSGSEDDSAE